MNNAKEPCEDDFIEYFVRDRSDSYHIRITSVEVHLESRSALRVHTSLSTLLEDRLENTVIIKVVVY